MISERKSAYMRSYYLRNREAKLADVARRRAERGHGTHLRKGVSSSETESYLPVLAADPCCYCGDKPGNTLDHIVPGKDSSVGNLTAACHSCNASKKTMPLLLFLLDRQLRRDLKPVADQIRLIRNYSCSDKRVIF